MASRPNILMITCHDLGRHLGCYGQATVRSPALVQLAESGVRLENSFCTAPQCSPSRASLHTGRYPHATGMLGLQNLGWNIDPQEQHLARLLHQAGYQTALIGLQHITSQPETLGYDQINNIHGAVDAGNAAAVYLHDSARSEGVPFYLEIGFFETHRPYNWQGNQPDEALGVEVPAYLPDIPAAREEFARLQGDIKQMDQGIGVILETLQDAGLEENTWVIFAADHGLPMPRAKCTLYDPGLEIAMLMRWPGGGISGGLVHPPLVSNVDLVPTILEGIGLDAPYNLQGSSFWKMLQDEIYRERQEIFAEKTYHTFYHPMRAVRTRTHKLIVNFEPSPLIEIPDDITYSPIYQAMIGELDGKLPMLEIYDLEEDPLERHNLAGEDRSAVIESDLKARLLNWMHETGDPLLAGTVTSPTHLNALEYLRG